MRVERNRLRWHIRLVAPLGLLVLASIAACSTAGSNYVDLEDEEAFGFPVARLTNLSDPVCGDSFSAQVASVLEKEGETANAAHLMTKDLRKALWYQPEPGPFYTVSPTGLRYGFVLQKTDDGCVLRLYQSHRKVRGLPGVSYVNTRDYIANRTVLYCSCSEDAAGPDEDRSRLAP